METTVDLLRPAEPGERFHPHTIPLYLVDRLVKAYRLEVFIETGTYMGHTVEHVLDQFKSVVTIELDSTLAANARWKFEANRHVHVLEGDAGALLAETLVFTDQEVFAVDCPNEGPRALVWLDAHYSGGITTGRKNGVDTSIRRELQALRETNRRLDHVLMIDDIDDFNGEHGYPTRMELMDLVYAINPAYNVLVLDIRRGVLVALPPAQRSD